MARGVNQTAWFIALACVAVLPTTTTAQTSRPSSRPAEHVQPIDLVSLRARVWDLPVEERKLLDLYMEAAAKHVLTVEDGCYPNKGNAVHWRNLAERAKGAAVLAALDHAWPAELRDRCRREATAMVREVALAHRAKPNLEYEWQASFWAAEAAIAAWFMWDELDADLRDAVAEMVVFQADRFIDKTPKMGFQGNTEAETVSWDSSILTLAVNMMPGHPHHAQWDQAAKRYLYNTFAVPQDAESGDSGDDGRPIRDWIVGANLYPDFALENHRQFHIDYVLACYRFHIQGAGMLPGAADMAGPRFYRGLAMPPRVPSSFSHSLRASGAPCRLIPPRFPP